MICADLGVATYEFVVEGTSAPNLTTEMLTALLPPEIRASSREIYQFTIKGGYLEELSSGPRAWMRQMEYQMNRMDPGPLMFRP
jgi:hypothetical protein